MQIWRSLLEWEELSMYWKTWSTYYCVIWGKPFHFSLPARSEGWTGPLESFWQHSSDSGPVLPVTYNKWVLRTDESMGKDVGLQRHWFIRNIKTGRLSLCAPSKILHEHQLWWLFLCCYWFNKAHLSSYSLSWGADTMRESLPACKSMKCSHYLKCAIAP